MPPAVAAKTVLLVDSEPLNRGRLKTALQEQGYRVLAVGGALEALLVGARQGITIDLLLTAEEMPGIDGHRLAEKFRQPFPSVAVMFLQPEPAEAAVERVRDTLGPARKPPAAQPGEFSAATG